MLHSKFGSNRSSRFLKKKVLMKTTELGIQRATAPSEKIDPDGGHDLKNYHCPDVSYQK